MNIKKLSLTLAATITLASTGTSNAQGFWNYFGERFGSNQTRSGHSPRHYGGPLNRTILALDNQSHQLYNDFAYQVRQHPRCPKVQALNGQMRTHMGSCDRLVKASKGACPKEFKAATICTNNSSNKLIYLGQSMDLSNSTQILMAQSAENAGWVVNNADRFRPVIPAPVYDPVYQKIGFNMQALPVFSNQLVSLYSNEVHCGCRDSMALLTNIRKYNTNVLSLDRAYKGTCEKAFKKAACDARETLSVVQYQRKNLKVSDRVCGLIRQSCPQLTYVHKNSSNFQPYQVSTSSGGCRASSAPRNGGSYSQTHYSW